MPEYTVVAEVYSFNERRAELDLPPLEQDGFEYTVTLLKNGCGCVVAEFDSQDGLQPFQLCRNKAETEHNAKAAQVEIQADVDKGNITSWFTHVWAHKCNH